MDFERDGRDWPNRTASRFVVAGGITWHVQVMGAGPALLLVHGTGASSHSWRNLVPLLQDQYQLIIPDLPGHAFTSPPETADGFTLPAMALALGRLMEALDIEPAVVAGHSAGAAILIRATLDAALSPRAIVSLNGALFPFGGAAGQFFSPLARVMVSIPWVPRFMSWRGKERSAVAKLLRDMGSEPTDEDVGYYARLFGDEGHIASTLAMMANWDLNPLVRDLSRLTTPLTLIAGAGDRAVLPRDAERAAKIARNSSAVVIPGSGHLTPEEQPGLVAPIIRKALDPLTVR